MKRIFETKAPASFYSTKNAALYLGDSFEILASMKPESVDLVFADPPYFLSTRKWINLCKRILKPSGTLWISGTLHNIYIIGSILEEEGFKIINNITWQKKNPPPNLACKCFTHSTETVIWATIDNGVPYYFNYKLMKEQNEGKQMKDVWAGGLTPPREKVFGKHPTQKPLYLLERIIDAASQPGDLIVDPFTGSSTTGVAALSRTIRPSWKFQKTGLFLLRKGQYRQLYSYFLQSGTIIRS